MRLRIEDDKDRLAQVAAAEIAGAISAVLIERDRCAVALTGGSTPRAAYRLLGEEPFLSRLAWDRIHFFWGDERHVPPDHADSNFRMAHEAFLATVPVPAENIHRIPAEDADAARAASSYEETLRGFFHLNADEKPRFDLLLLGLGPDAHIASLFPGNAALHEHQKLVIAPWVEKMDTFRITLTVPVLDNAARVLFLVSGEEKSAAVRNVLEGERNPDLYPGQLLRLKDGEVIWLLDRDAASRLSRH
ncbi:MAG TPA: 6-phosphogluconolactonase [Thermoanaerobaculia bacterium]|nr:6-phosphogluconolactonase [Thermoanaerobaculia bacterium]